MSNKLKFLTKMSLDKKIKTKWFWIANIIFAILIIGVINIDSIIKFFGGDFDETTEILVIDKTNSFNTFKETYESYSNYIKDYDNVSIKEYTDDFKEDYSDVYELVSEEEKILLIIENDPDNYIKAKVVSKDGIGTITDTLINTSIQSVRSEIALEKYNIKKEEFEDINKKVLIEDIILSDDSKGDDLTITTIMQIITLPVFMLIMFLVQMIGAEVNEEKSTRSMEIIISNVSPKTHFAAKVLSSNLFVLIQGGLLIVYALMGIGLRFIINKGNVIGSMDSDIISVIDKLSLNGVMDTLGYMIPVILLMMILTFIAYSLLAGILASMTTNLEDFQQLQTPIVVVSLVGYYLSMAVTVFKGSIFIKIMSFIPFISSMLAPTMYVLGEITLLDLSISIFLLIGVIYLLIKYGIRIYKVGILNYSQTGLWKKMAKALKNK